MQNKVKITFLASAGIMISYESTKILIDAIQTGNDYFSSLKKNTLDNILSGNDIFNNINFLIYSHYHEDHIDFSANLKFLEKNKVQNIILPFDPYHRAIDFKETLTQRNIKYIEPNVSLNEKQTLVFADNITVNCYRTPHDGGDKYKSVFHNTFLINIGGKNILIGADSPISDCFLYEDLRSNYHIDLALFNLLFINSRKGRELIGQINPDKLVVYHLPFSDHQNKMFRNIAITDAEKYKETLPQTTVFSEELMEIDI